MSEVQYRAYPLFPFVPAHDLGLYGAGHLYGLYYLFAGLKELAGVLLEKFEKRAVPDDAVLYHLGEPGPQFPFVEGLQYIRVYEYRPGLIERADKVLAPGVVDGRFAAHRAVHLRKERRGHLYKRHPAQISSGDEP